MKIKSSSIIILLISLSINCLGQIPTTNLEGYWPFNGNANDESGKGNNGTVYGASLATDRFGNVNKAYYFNGASWIQVAHSASINFNVNESYSISLWVKVKNTNNYGDVFDKWETNLEGYPYTIRIAGPSNGEQFFWHGRYIGGLPQDSTHTQSLFYYNTIDTNIFYHIVATYEPTVMKMYVNGLFKGEQTNYMVSGNVANLHDLFIGKRGGSNSRYFYGNIDDIRLYRKALSVLEINALYNEVYSPTNQASNITSSTNMSSQLTLNWTNGNGSKRAVFIKQATTGSPDPANYTTYNPNTAFGSGSQIGTSGWYCVFNGTTHPTGVTVIGLQSNTTYRVMLCEYNGIPGAEVYNTASATSNPANIHTCTTVPVSLSISASANPVCAGANVTFSSTPVNGGTTPAYQWKKGDVNISGATNATYAYSPLYGDVISCVLTSNAACTSGSPAISNSITMIVTPLNPVSVLIFSSSTYVCEGSSLTFFANPLNGGSAPVYQWKVNGINAGTNSQFYEYIPFNNDQVSCVVSSNISCSANNPATSNTMDVVVNPLLSVSVSIEASQNPICEGSPVIFTTNPVNPGNSQGYEWKVNNSTISGATSSTYSYIPAANDLVKCIMTSTVLCPLGSPATSNIIHIQTKPISIPVISGPTNVCKNAVGNVYTTQASMTNYSWNVNGGNITNGGGLANNSAVVTWTNTGTQSVSVNYVNNEGCTAAAPTQYNVAVSNLQAPGIPGTITGLTNVTSGQSNVGYSIPLIPGAINYEWQLPAGAVITSGQNTNSIIVTFSPTSTSGVITVYGTNNCGNGPLSNGLFVNVGSNIPVVLNLYNLNHGSGTNNCYNATQNIQVAGNGSVFNIFNGAIINMIAGKKITFLPGTNIYTGGNLHGYITSTGNYCQNPALPIVAIQTETEAPYTWFESSMFNIYPNPTSGDYTMELKTDPDNQPVLVKCYNILGSEISRTVLYSGTKHLFTLNSQEPGIYLLRISREGKDEIKKISKY